MPLTRRQFELGIDEECEGWMRQVYEILEDNRHLAYSSEELRKSVLSDDQSSAKAQKFSHALDVLTQISAVDMRWFDDIDYYAYLQDFDTGTWKSAKLAPAPARNTT